MSCLSRIGCVTVVVLGGAGACWLYGGNMPDLASALGRVRNSPAVASDKGSKPVAWASLKDASRSSEDIVATLSSRTGPAYVSLSAADVGVLLTDGLARALPSAARSAQVAIDGDLIRVRAVIPLRELGGEGIPSFIGGVLSEQDTVELAGGLEMVHTGLAQYRVRALRVRNTEIPSRLIPPLMRSLQDRAMQADSLAGDAVGIPVPKTVADVRVSRGKVTLYKTAPKP